MDTVLILNWKLVNVFRLGDCVMVGQTADHLTEGAELKRQNPGNLNVALQHDKIRKMIRKCKADTKAIKQLDDEQTEYLERLRKHP